MKATLFHQNHTIFTHYSPIIFPLYSHYIPNDSILIHDHPQSSRPGGPARPSSRAFPKVHGPIPWQVNTPCGSLSTWGLGRSLVLVVGWIWRVDFRPRTWGWGVELGLEPGDGVFFGLEPGDEVEDDHEWFTGWSIFRNAIVTGWPQMSSVQNPCCSMIGDYTTLYMNL